MDLILEFDPLIWLDGKSTNEIHDDKMKDKMCKKKIGKSSLISPCELTLVLWVKLKTEIYTKDWIVHFKGRSVRIGSSNLKFLWFLHLPNEVTQEIKPARNALNGNVPTRQQ